MAKSEQQRQKKLAKRHKRANDVRKLARVNRNLSTRDVLLQALGNRWELCFKRQREGMASVVAVRRMRTGSPISVCFLIDSYCLGVKDAYVSRDMDLERIRQMIREGGDEVTIVSPEYVLKFVREAIAYAHRLGIEPAKSAELCLLLFSDVDASECHEEFCFGKDGKPLYMAGPHDSPERMQQIMEQLAKLGSDNFEYIMPIGAESTVELRQWDELAASGEGLEQLLFENEGDTLDDDELEVDQQVIEASDVKRIH